jgi:hypothetical protein
MCKWTQAAEPNKKKANREQLPSNGSAREVKNRLSAKGSRRIEQLQAGWVLAKIQG